MAIAEAQRTQIIDLTVGMFSAAPGPVFLGDLESFVEAGGSMLDLANVLAGTTLFRSSSFYPPFLFPSEFAPKFVDNLFSGGGVAASDRAWAVNWIIGKLNAGESVGKVCYDAIMALDAVGDPVNGYSNPAFANVAQAFDNRVAVAGWYSVTDPIPATNINLLQGFVEGVNADPESVLLVPLRPIFTGCDYLRVLMPYPFVRTVWLTPTQDVLNGTAADEMASGYVNDGSVTGPATTLNVTDAIDGGPGQDTLWITVMHQDTPFIVPNARNVEVLRVEDAYGSNWDLSMMPQLDAISEFGGSRGTTFSNAQNLISRIHISDVAACSISIPVPNNRELFISVNPNVEKGAVTLFLTDISVNASAWFVQESNSHGGLMTTVTINSAGDNTHFSMGATENLVSAKIVGGTGGKQGFLLTDYSSFTSLDASQYQGELTAVIGDHPNAITIRLGNSNNNTITLGDGKDTVKVDAASPWRGSHDSIIGFSTGDTIDLSTINLGTSAFTSAQVTLTATAAFQDYLDAVCAGSVTSNGVFSWFQWNGDTYLAEDRSAASTFQESTDFVIRLVGLVDLSHASGTGVDGAYGGDGILIGG